jgi:predicted acyltransferase
MIDSSTNRLLSLDVFRGITVALMILVNSQGNNSSYHLLKHAEWNGVTLADLVFPSFIFILGVSVVLSLSKKQQLVNCQRVLIDKILKRSLILFFIGFLLDAFPYHIDFSTARVLGVLQRIAICYCFSSFLFITTRIYTQVIIMLFLTIGYWLLMTQFAHGFDLTRIGNLASYIDTILIGPKHLYTNEYDPEGLLSTLPALATTLLGNLTGAWLLTAHSDRTKISGLTVFGFISMIIGYLWGFSFPFNKSLWTSSFVFWTGGISILGFALCYWFLEVKGARKWSRSFELFGMNALLAFVLHVFFLKLQAMVHLQLQDGTWVNLRVYISSHLFGWTSDANAALLYAIVYTILWLLVLRLFKAHTLPSKIYYDGEPRVRN